ncbi:hypothetical protein T492DRAFT_971309 [Pavlovales sp. CCMP2436]|nr:hypothetical protein T492DRAFT_971309 [Pavlovales sp. CCMP2436]
MTGFADPILAEGGADCRMALATATWVPAPMLSTATTRGASWFRRRAGNRAFVGARAAAHRWLARARSADEPALGLARWVRATGDAAAARRDRLLAGTLKVWHAVLARARLRRAGLRLREAIAVLRQRDSQYELERQRVAVRLALALAIMASSTATALALAEAGARARTFQLRCGLVRLALALLARARKCRTLTRRGGAVVALTAGFHRLAASAAAAQRCARAATTFRSLALARALAWYVAATAAAAARRALPGLRPGTPGLGFGAAKRLAAWGVWSAAHSRAAAARALVAQSIDRWASAGITRGWAGIAHSRARARRLERLGQTFAHFRLSAHLHEWSSAVAAGRTGGILAALRASRLRGGLRRWWRAWRLTRRRELVVALCTPLANARAKRALGARRALAAQRRVQPQSLVVAQAHPLGAGSVAQSFVLLPLTHFAALPPTPLRVWHPQQLDLTLLTAASSGAVSAAPTERMPAEWADSAHRLELGQSSAAEGAGAGALRGLEFLLALRPFSDLPRAWV